MLASPDWVGYEAPMSNDTAVKINAAVEAQVRTFVEQLTILVKDAIRDLVTEAAGKIEVRSGAAHAPRTGVAKSQARSVAVGSKGAAGAAKAGGRAAARATAAGAAGSTRTAAAARKPAQKLPTTASGKRTAAEMKRAQDAVLAWVRANPGQRVEPMAKALGVATKDITRPLAKLAAAKLIRREGEKRATRYFPASGPASGSSQGPDAAGTSEAAAKATPAKGSPGKSARAEAAATKGGKSKPRSKRKGK